MQIQRLLKSGLKYIIKKRKSDLCSSEDKLNKFSKLNLQLNNQIEKNEKETNLKDLDNLFDKL